MTRLQIEIGQDKDDSRFNRTGSVLDRSNTGSEADFESNYYNESAYEYAKDTNDERAFRKNMTNEEKQQELVSDVSASLVQKLKDINQKRQYVTRTASIEHLKQ